MATVPQLNKPVKLSELALTKAVLLLLCGDPGVGKTFFIGSTGSRTVIFSDKNGLVTLKNPLIRKLYPDFDPWIEVIEKDNQNDLAKSYMYLIDRINYWFTGRLADFDTVVIEDTDFLKLIALNHAVSINSLSGKSETRTKIGQYNYVMPAIQDYGTEMGIVESFFANLASLCRLHDKNLIVNAHLRNMYKKDPRTKEDILTKVLPYFTGKAAPTAVGDDFDLIVYMTRIGDGEKSIPKFRFHPDDVYLAKDRYSVFKTIEEKITWPKILERIQKAIPENSVDAEAVVEVAKESETKLSNTQA